ncbi:MAG: anthranilate synthase component I family protein [Cytophagales bacterium]
MRKESLKFNYLNYYKTLKWVELNYSHCVAFNNYSGLYTDGFNVSIHASNYPLIFESPDSIPNDKFLVGILSYDYKNHIEPLHSKHTSSINFPDFGFFEPELSIVFKGEEIEILAVNSSEILEKIKDFVFEEIKNTTHIFLNEHTTKELYINTLNKIKSEIHLGNVYEMNYCILFETSEIHIDPITIFKNLSTNSPTPFLCFVKFDTNFLLCASPERFLKKQDKKLISQPIKGTKSVVENTQQEVFSLQSNLKEQNENVMIVDLVRNDLSKIAKAGTVKVDELFGVYKFGNLYQMISTISAEIDNHVTFKDIVDATFPMGSMTGAPKLKTMELTEKYENFKRNIYAGSVGYIEPNGNFDFNVVIRSIFWNADNCKISFAVGSGITAMSNPEQEYDECLLKAEKILKVLNNLK